MKQRLKDIFDADRSTDDYSTAVFNEFGLSSDKHYDLLVVAPGWTPAKIMKDFDAEITQTASHSYISGYEVKGDGFLMAWIQTSPGACSLIDELALCAALDFDKLVFAGAVGSLTKDTGMGALCTPSFSISGNLANGYLMEDITQYKPFEKVYPNDPKFVSDNSATGESLVLRTAEQKEVYNATRFKVIPEILIRIASSGKESA